ncbi:MAG: adenylate kinase family protein [Desulfurococcaceae archaeon]|nr:adenylate kinase family protein [Desulfurococcaceae archaeon]
MKCIGISGTPGTGKSSVARELSKELQIPVIELSEFVVNNNLYLYYDAIRNSYVVDEEKLRNSIAKLYRERGAFIIVGHYVEILERDLYELVIVLRRNPIELLNILKTRRWPDSKVAENVEAELLSVCTFNAIEELGEDLVVEVDVTSKNVSEVVNEIMDILLGLKSVYLGHRIDWLSLVPEKDLEAILSYIEKYRLY